MPAEIIEKIIHVPVEKIIVKEVPVEKVIYKDKLIYKEPEIIEAPDIFPEKSNKLLDIVNKRFLRGLRPFVLQILGLNTEISRLRKELAQKVEP